MTALLKRLKRFFKSPLVFITAAALLGYAFFSYGLRIYIPVTLDRIMPSSVEMYQKYYSYVGLQEMEDDRGGYPADTPYSSRLSLSYCIPDRISYVSKDIRRDGEMIRLVYYYHAETLASRFYYGLLPDRSPTEYGTHVSLAIREAGEESIRTEVYYLIADFDKMPERSDASYDQERYNGKLVWDGWM